MNAAKRFEIFRRLHEDNPEPKTELAYSTPFELLVAVTLSAQATDVSVNKATAKLMYKMLLGCILVFFSLVRVANMRFSAGV